MKCSVIIDAVVDAIQDESFERADILAYINKAVDEIAAQYALPELTVFGNINVEGGKFLVALPDNYLSNLFHAVNLTTGKEVDVMSELANFLLKFKALDKSDNVTHVCVHGRKLYYQGIPTSTQVIRAFYTSRPEPFKENSEIEYIPAQLQRDLLFNYACAECFNLIEDGIDGTKVNQNKYLGFYTAALAKLSNFIEPRQATPDFIPGDEEHERDI